jgi:hypothetical protein
VIREAAVINVTKASGPYLSQRISGIAAMGIWNLRTFAPISTLSMALIWWINTAARRLVSTAVVEAEKPADLPVQAAPR